MPFIGELPGHYYGTPLPRLPPSSGKNSVCETVCDEDWLDAPKEVERRSHLDPTPWFMGLWRLADEGLAHPYHSNRLTPTHPDAEKDKYFKIEADNRATPSVKYTTGSVKRIANECHDARVDEKVKRIRREGTVRRALPPGDPAGALLRREMGAYVDGAEADVAAGLWASGLERKGVLRGTWGGEIVDMFVGGEKDTGLATVFHGKLSRWSWRGLVADSEQLLMGMRLWRPTFHRMLMMSGWLGPRMVYEGLC